VGLDPARLGIALRALEPDALVLAGRHATLDSLGRIVYAARSAGQPVAVLDFLGALPDTGASTVRRLPDGVLAARDSIVERLDAPALEQVPRPARRFARQGA
jgi:hypothetical protein